MRLLVVIKTPQIVQSHYWKVKIPFWTEATRSELKQSINATESQKREDLKYFLFKMVDSARLVPQLRRHLTNMDYLVLVNRMVKADPRLIKSISSKVRKSQFR